MDGWTNSVYFLLRYSRAWALTFGKDDFAPPDIRWRALWHMIRAGTFFLGLD